MSRAKLLVPHRKIVNLYKLSEKKFIEISQFEINNGVLAPVFTLPPPTTFPFGYWKPWDSEETIILSWHYETCCRWIMPLWAFRWPSVCHSKYNHFYLLTRGIECLTLITVVAHRFCSFIFLVAFKSSSGIFLLLLIL